MPLRTLLIHWMNSKYQPEQEFERSHLDDLEGFKTSGEEVGAGVVEIGRKLGWEVDSKDVTELVQSHNKTFRDENFLLMYGFLRWNLFLVKRL